MCHDTARTQGSAYTAQHRVSGRKLARIAIQVASTAWQQSVAAARASVADAKVEEGLLQQTVLLVRFVLSVYRMDTDYTQTELKQSTQQQAADSASRPTQTRLRQGTQ